MSRETCNNCRSLYCKVWDRTKDDKLKNVKLAMQAIELEKAQALPCHVKRNIHDKRFKFTDCISKVIIENQNNPVIAIMRNYA